MLMTNEYILECLEKYCSFEELSEDNFYTSVVQPLEDAHCFNDWSYSSGVTKGVLIFKGLDFVVKIPFSGSGEYYEEHWENEEDGEWIGCYTKEERYTHTPANLHFCEEKTNFREFTGADEEEGWNYCKVEAQVSKCAEEEGVIRCFAETYFLGTAGDYPIYAQERCAIFCDEESSRRESYKKRTKSDYDSLREVRERVDFYDCDDNWLLDFLIYWGEEILQRLANFVFEHSINDLHNGNIGYRKGVPVLVDYSSFHD